MQYTFGRRIKTAQRGFTVVELVVLITVVAILASLATFGFNAIRTDALDTDRAARVETISDALEQYAAKNGRYPECAAIQGPSVDGFVALMPTIDRAALRAPEAPSDVENSIHCAVLLSAGGIDRFAYSTTGSTFSITYIERSTGTLQTKQSRSTLSSVDSAFGEAPPDVPVSTGCPSGYITVPGNASFGTSDFCVMKYEAKDVGGVATSQAAGIPWASITRPDAATAAAAACASCRLISETEWMTIAANVASVSSNWTGGAFGSGSLYIGHADNSPASRQAASTNDNDGYYLTGQTSGTQRRTFTLTNGEVIWDFSGNVAEFTTGSLPGSGSYPGISGQGFQWYEWNNPSLDFRGLESTSLPSAISAQASSVTSAQGIGRLYTAYGGSNPSAFVRGGSYTNTTSGTFAFANDAGILSLYLGFNSGSSSGAMIGFRLTATP